MGSTSFTPECHTHSHSLPCFPDRFCFRSVAVYPVMGTSHPEWGLEGNKAPVTEKLAPEVPPGAQSGILHSAAEVCLPGVSPRDTFSHGTAPEGRLPLLSVTQAFLQMGGSLWGRWHLLSERCKCTVTPSHG